MYEIYFKVPIMHLMDQEIHKFRIIALQRTQFTSVVSGNFVELAFREKQNVVQITPVAVGITPVLVGITPRSELPRATLVTLLIKTPNYISPLNGHKLQRYALAGYS